MARVREPVGFHYLRGYFRMLLRGRVLCLELLRGSTGCGGLRWRARAERADLTRLVGGYCARNLTV